MGQQTWWVVQTGPPVLLPLCFPHHNTPLCFPFPFFPVPLFPSNYLLFTFPVSSCYSAVTLRCFDVSAWRLRAGRTAQCELWRFCQARWLWLLRTSARTPPLCVSACACPVVCASFPGASGGVCEQSIAAAGKVKSLLQPHRLPRHLRWRWRGGRGESWAGGAEDWVTKDSNNTEMKPETTATTYEKRLRCK